ncbi:MAG: ABC transporter permease [Acidimicrobiia bacterium]
MIAAGGPDSIIWWAWVEDHIDDIMFRLRQHITLTVLSVILGVLIALPLAIVASRRRALYTPLLVVGSILYTIPSLAAFVLLIEWTSRRDAALIVLTSYTILVLVRNTVTGLDGVPADIKEAAQGMGYSRLRLLLSIELPIALPAIVAGVRIATVTNVGLVTVAALIGQGGLGALILDGLRRDFSTPLMVGALLSIMLAVTLDLGLLGLQRLATPWQRRGARS